MRNPLIQLGFEIPFDQIEAAHVEPAVDALLASAQAAVDAIAESGRASNLREHARRARRGHRAARTGHDGGRPSRKRGDDRRLARRLQRHATEGECVLVGARDERRPLPGRARVCGDRGSRKRSLRPRSGSWKRPWTTSGGTARSSARKTRPSCRRSRVDLTKLTTEFSQNVLDETNAFELIITDESKLAGLPESAKQAAAENASSERHRRAGASPCTRRA